MNYLNQLSSIETERNFQFDQEKLLQYRVSEGNIDLRFVVS